MVNKAWLGFFIFLWVVFFIASAYDIYNPTYVFGPFATAPSPQVAGTELGWAFVGSFFGAGLLTIFLRVIYVGLKRLF